MCDGKKVWHVHQECIVISQGTKIHQITQEASWLCLPGHAWMQFFARQQKEKLLFDSQYWLPEAFDYEKRSSKGSTDDKGTEDEGKGL